AWRARAVVRVWVRGSVLPRLVWPSGTEPGWVRVPVLAEPPSVWRWAPRSRWKWRGRRGGYPRAGGWSGRRRCRGRGGGRGGPGAGEWGSEGGPGEVGERPGGRRTE